MAQTLHFAHQVQDQSHASKWFVAERAQFLDPFEGSDRVGIEPVSCDFWIGHGRQQPLLAINQNSSSRYLRQLGGPFDGIDNAGARIKKLNCRAARLDWRGL